MVTLKFHDKNSKERNLEVFAKNGDYFSEDEKKELLEDGGQEYLLHQTQLICIKLFHDVYNNYEWINLDKSTAIKLSKELRKQIALLD